MEYEEKKVHDSLSSEAKKVVEGKKFLLLGEMLRMIGHEDKSLVEDLMAGMRITGNSELSGVFPVDFRPAYARAARPNTGEWRSSLNKRSCRRFPSTWRPRKLRLVRRKGGRGQTGVGCHRQGGV